MVPGARCSGSPLVPRYSRHERRVQLQRALEAACPPGAAEARHAQHRSICGWWVAAGLVVAGALAFVFLARRRGRPSDRRRERAGRLPRSTAPTTPRPRGPLAAPRRRPDPERRAGPFTADLPTPVRLRPGSALHLRSVRGRHHRSPTRPARRLRRGRDVGFGDVLVGLDRRVGCHVVRERHPVHGSGRDRGLRPVPGSSRSHLRQLPAGAVDRTRDGRFLRVPHDRADPAPARSARGEGRDRARRRRAARRHLRELGRRERATELRARRPA